jgi:hypothetical protein
MFRCGDRLIGGKESKQRIFAISLLFSGLALLFAGGQ